MFGCTDVSKMFSFNFSFFGSSESIASLCYRFLLLGNKRCIRYRYVILFWLFCLIKSLWIVLYFLMFGFWWKWRKINFVRKWWNEIMFDILWYISSHDVVHVSVEECSRHFFGHRVRGVDTRFYRFHKKQIQFCPLLNGKMFYVNVSSLFRRLSRLGHEKSALIIFKKTVAAYCGISICSKINLT